MEELVKIRENFVSMQICTTIPPERKGEINEKMRECGLAVSGTTSGWMLKEDVDPVPCADYEGRWHYICEC